MLWLWCCDECRGYAFATPLLSSYEAEVALNSTQWQTEAYPMDYYSGAGGSWSNYHIETKQSTLAAPTDKRDRSALSTAERIAQRKAKMSAKQNSIASAAAAATGSGSGGAPAPATESSGRKRVEIAIASADPPSK